MRPTFVAQQGALRVSMSELSPSLAKAVAWRGYTPAQIQSHVAMKARQAREGMFARIAAAQNRPLYPPIPAAAFKEAHAILDCAPPPLPSEPVSIKRIQIAAAEEYGVTLIDLLSDRRSANVVLPRQIAMYLAWAMTKSSTTGIGRCFGGRDHTTVMHGYRKIEAMVAGDPDFAARVARLRARIG